MAGEQPTYITYPRTGALGGVPETSFEELVEVADTRQWTLAALAFGIVGVGVLLCYYIPSSGLDGKTLGDVLSELWGPMVIAQALEAYLLNLALYKSDAVNKSLARYRVAVAVASALVPLGGIVAPTVVVGLIDGYFKRRGIIGFFLRPKNEDLARWVESFGAAPLEQQDGQP